jgi:hypothetical protein
MFRATLRGLLRGPPRLYWGAAVPSKRSDVNGSAAAFVYRPEDLTMRGKLEHEASARVMGTRFRPADPEAVRQRFAAIRARAIHRVDEEQRLILARLESERWAERGSLDDDRRDVGVRHVPDAPDAGHD